MKIDNLVLDQSFAVDVETVTAPVTVRRPGKGEFFRIHPEDKYGPFAVLRDAERNAYVVSRAVASEVLNDATIESAFRAINRFGEEFVFLVKMDANNDWTRSLHTIIGTAKQRWVRMDSQRNLGRYTATAALKDLGDPQWSQTPFPELLEKAFGSASIDSLDHPLIKELRGAV